MANTILVVDNHAVAVARLVHALTTAGLAATGVQGFTDALKLLGSTRTDLLIASVRLGPYNGLHLLLRARALYPNMTAIIIGPADPALARDAVALGASAYLTTLSPDGVVLEALKILRPLSTRPGTALPPRPPSPA